MKSILFFDDFLIHRQPSVERRFHTPDWIDDSGYSDPASLYGMGYASVVAEPDDSGYYLYYVCATGNEKIAGELATVVSMAESDDGLSWQPIRTERAPEGFPPYTLIGGMPAPAGWWAYDQGKTRVTGPRYLSTNSPILRAEVGIETVPSVVLGSDDGLEWNELPGSQFLPHHSDTCNAIMFNPVKNRYQITLRRRWGERRIFQVESEDLRTWTDPHPILHPSSIDPESTHFYGMPTYQTDSGIFIGSLWTQRMPYNDVMGGPVTTEYAYSYDGELWNRTYASSAELREPGTYGSGSMYQCGMIERGDETIVYAVARLEEHHAIKSTVGAGRVSGVLLPGRLRRNGFVSLRSTRGRGEITTECLSLAHPDITVNIRAPLGGVRAQLCDPQYRPIEGCAYADSVEVTGDHLAFRLRWRDESGFQRAIEDGKWIRLQIQLEHAEIFSIDTEFEFTINDLAPRVTGL